MTALLPPHQSTTFHDALLGDPAALDALLARHRSAVEAVCFRRLRSRIDAEDAVQETLAKGMRSLEYVEDPSRLKSYLCRIAERVCLDMLRDGAKAMPAVIEDTVATTAVEDNPEDAALDRERTELVHRTLQALNERQATALWMRDAMGESVPTVAAHLGVTEGSARVLLTRARAKMRDGWAKVAAIFPAGFGLPSMGAKVITLGPLAIPAAIPVVVVAVMAAASPVALQVLATPDDATVTSGHAAFAKGSDPLPATTAPPAADPEAQPTTATTTTPAAPATGTTIPTSPSSHGVGPAPSAAVDVGGTTVTAGREEAAPEEDDLILGNADILELGTADPTTVVGTVMDAVESLGDS